MKTLHFDSLGGASGDMILGALCALGADSGELRKQLGSLGIGNFSIECPPFKSHALQGVQCRVNTPKEHAHRHLADIRGMIADSTLPEPVQAEAIRVFSRIAEAEATVHGTTPDKIHFHEVGAMDSIIDICGACLAKHLLEIETVSVGTLPLGRGTISCAHGVMPCPAPATLLLLENMPVEQTDQPFELVTPTGAALLAEWKSADRIPAGSMPLQTAFSFGHRELENRPNLLRATLYQTGAEQSAGTGEAILLETNIDDMTPELAGALTEKLRDCALDVWTVAVQMKKQRPGILLSVLCEPARKSDCIELIFRESSTFGIRELPLQRHILDREFITVATVYGKIRVKRGLLRGRCVTQSPEIADCERAAAEHNSPLKTVYNAALAACHD